MVKIVSSLHAGYMTKILCHQLQSVNVRVNCTLQDTLAVVKRA